jgi:NAD(P)-dependent dehydrogenase (short-subunit alcohol dehydrogenase family)
VTRPTPCAWVTGGAQGIGRAIGERLAADGFRVALIDRQQEHVEAAAAAVGGVAACVDLAQTQAIPGVVARLMEQTGVPTVLVNNAGIVAISSLVELSDDDWEQTLAINLTGAVMLTRSVLPAMIQSRRGRVVSISSSSAVRVGRGQTAYATSKAGLIAFSKVLALEVAEYGITSNVVCPGVTRTEMTLAAYGGEEEMAQVAAAGAIANPMGVVLDPADIAHVVSFLADEKTRYVTGQTIHCNAGSYMP